MRLAEIRHVYEEEGPFATVYLEGRSPAEDATEQKRLRWKGLRERLESQGATAGALDLLESALRSDAAGEVEANGRILVATDSAIVLDAPWDAALGSGDNAHWGVLPELGAYVREAAQAVRTLLVIANQQGAQVRQEVVSEQHEPREIDAESVKGGAVEGVHKPRGGALSHKQIQRRADESVGQNAKDIVRYVSRVADDFRPRVLVLAGEVQARTALHHHLPEELSHLVVDTGRGGLGENASDEALTDEVLRIAGEEQTRAAEHDLDRLREGMAHHLAVQGHESVARAAELSAVDTLLLEAASPASREAFLLKSCALTSSAVAVVPEGTGLADRVAALLRFPLES
jgi:hypothetical protein